MALCRLKPVTVFSAGRHSGSDISDPSERQLPYSGAEALVVLGLLNDIHAIPRAMPSMQAPAI